MKLMGKRCVPLAVVGMLVIAAVGCAGPEGPAGLRGLQGPAGLQGPVGQQGLEGPVGPQGIEGPTGLQGPARPNMIVAMGSVYSWTEELHNPYNVTSVTWDPGWEQWWIRLTDIEYFVTDYVTIVTPIGGAYAGYSSQGDLLAVTLYDSNGAKTKGVGFSFVVLEMR